MNATLKANGLKSNDNIDSEEKVPSICMTRSIFRLISINSKLHEIALTPLLPVYRWFYVKGSQCKTNSQGLGFLRILKTLVGEISALQVSFI